MCDIHGELHTGALATGKARDLLDHNPCDRADASIRLHDPARNFFPQRGIFHNRNTFKAPKRALQTGDVFREKHNSTRVLTSSIDERLRACVSRKNRKSRWPRRPRKRGSASRITPGHIAIRLCHSVLPLRWGPMMNIGLRILRGLFTNTKSFGSKLLGIPVRTQIQQSDHHFFRDPARDSSMQA